MRWTPLLLCAAIVPAEAASQQVIDHTRVRRYAGEEITVEGPVARVAPGSGGSLWFSLGRPHPSATLVIVVLEEFAKGFDTPRNYEGAIIQVTGRIHTGEASGTGIDPTNTPRLRGGNPRTPFILLQDISRFKVITPPPGVRPDTGAVSPSPLHRLQ